MYFAPQRDQMDCGISCLSMISDHYKNRIPIDILRDKCSLTREGISLLGLSETSNSIGFKTCAIKISTEDLIDSENIFPCILHWNQNHFVVLEKISKNKFHIIDPAHGSIKLNKDDFKNYWESESKKGILLILEPTDEFYSFKYKKQKNIPLINFYNELYPYRHKFILIFTFLLLGSGLTLFLPFLSKEMIDKGINNKDTSLIWLILIGQLGILTSNLLIELFRNWITLSVGANVSVSIVSSFFQKILKLPIIFFETKVIGDFSQRFNDNEKIEKFLTSESLVTILSVITFFILISFLLLFNYNILLIYITLTLISFIWSFYWIKKKKNLDYKRFSQRIDNNQQMYEIIEGISEIKLNNIEDIKRREWEIKQLDLFKTNIKLSKLDQIQILGFNFINQLKNFLVITISAIYVTNKSMTLGELMSISFIVGQINTPLNQLINFFKSFQEIKLSLDRSSEIRNAKDETEYNYLTINNLNEDIFLNNVYFQYDGDNSPYILNNIDLFIPFGKITAIVGPSGSGKTSLLKLLLKFNTPTSGKIMYGNNDITQISPKKLRNNCGVVLQEGYIFSDSIVNNIITGHEYDFKKFSETIKIANLESFINSLPLGEKTKIGALGKGLSGGQKQRILIARAVYKNPNYIFFDEATSSLDSKNENIIHTNLQDFFKEKTVVIIAHRLSTVKNADQIIVLNKGKIIETGNHDELVNKKSTYYELIKNQLELGT